MAGRREVPVDPGAGPVQRFAYELRRLRQDAGPVTYRVMAERAGYSVTTLSRAAAGEQLPSLAVAMAYVRACGGDPAVWEERWRAALDESAVERAEEEAERSDPPYRGLARFEPGDRERFFGRDRLVEDLTTLVAARRVVAVVGGSGSGKSSLLRAGLIPYLQEHPPSAGEGDRGVRGAGSGPGSGSGRHPGTGPAPGPGPGHVTGHVTGHGTGHGTGTDEVPAALAPRPGGAGCGPAAIRILTPGERPARTHGHLFEPSAEDGDTVIIVDQFEETFTLVTDATERTRFIDLLLTAEKPGSRLRVVLALRADFYGRLADYRGLTDAVRESTLLIGAMTRDELREAITRPAKAHGLTVERELTQRVLDDIADEPAALPLMSHALLETWRRRRARTLTLAAYQASGGVHGAVAATAEAAYARLTTDQALLARRALLRLITPGDGAPDTRRPVPRQELLGVGGSAADTALVLERLAAARLITLDQDTVDLTHEALITAWPRLRGWIDHGRHRLRVHRRLTEAAQTWHALRQDTGALYRGLRLAEAQETFGAPHHPGDLTPLEHRFLTASATALARERSRRHVLTAAVSILLALTLIAGATAWQRNRTGEQRLAEATSRRVAALADSMRYSDPRVAMRLSVAAWRIHPTLEARGSLFGALTQQESDVLRVDLPQKPGLSGTVELSPDGRIAVVRRPDDRATVWDVTRPEAQPHHVPLDPSERIEREQISPPYLATGVANGQERIRHLKTGAMTLLPAPGTEGVQRSGPYGHILLLRTQRSVIAWDIRRKRPVLQREGPTRQAVLSQDGSLVALCTAAGTAELWDTRSARPVPVPGRAALSRVACSPTARQLTLSALGRKLVVHTDERLHVWALTLGRELSSVPVIRSSPHTLSQDGRFLVTATDQEILVWRVDRLNTAAARKDAPVYRYRIKGGTLAYVTLDAEAGLLRYVEQHPSQPVRSVSLGDVLTTEWRQEATATAPDASVSPDDTETAVAVSPGGGRSRATGNVQGWVTVWNDRGERRSEFVATSTASGEEAPEAVTDLEYSPDGTVLVSGGSTGTVQLWDAASSRPLGGPLLTAGDGVRSLTFDQDGETLTVDGDHTPARTYPVSPERVIAAVCARAGSGLSQQLWKKHIQSVKFRDTC
ncbi:DNA-binding protein [Streptomyces sp. NPDC057638]|uniref:nSTAND1 domain-containing NTPase n=1 Tax=Streptomyces sp. NPDC057638 TaxID=3346190 RepID=UPI0036A8D6F9